MHLFTEVEIPNYPFKINYKDKLFFIGSCFVENIGNYLYSLNLPVVVNPFGVVYNPSSIVKQFEILFSNKTFTEKDLQKKENGHYYNYNFHSSFSGYDAKEIINKINNSIKNARNSLINCKYFFFTFGTAWIYILKENNEVVSNCHKIPSYCFERKRLEINDITKQFSLLLDKIKKLNKEAKFVFTISPIRHIKDGAIENMLSKSILKVAIHKIIENNKDCFYFPAFEIMYDELRDYRFYEKDLIHLNDISKEIILKKFKEAFYDKKNLNVINKLEKLYKSVNHKPFFPDSPEYKDFIKKLNEKIEHTEKEIGIELNSFKKQI